MHIPRPLSVLSFCGYGATVLLLQAGCATAEEPRLKQTAQEPKITLTKSQIPAMNGLAQNPDVSASLQQIESLYTGVLPWMARLYDADQGGFYESLAMRAQPKSGPDIQSTYFALNILDEDGLLKTMPPEIKAKSLEYLQTRQNAKTGFFSDPAWPQMEEQERVMGRSLQFATSSLKMLGAEPLHPLPGAQAEALPERFASQANLKKWLDARNWEQPWGALDAVSSQKSFLLSLPAEQRDPLVKFIYDYVVAKQDPQTGMVGGGEPIIRISGMAKFGWFCKPFDLPLPRADADYAFVMNWYRSTPEVETMTMIRNPIHHLSDLQPSLSQPMSEADKQLVVRETARLIRGFYQKDGAFAMHKNHYPLRPNGMEKSIGKSDAPQSDLNGTSQARVIREKAHEMMGVAREKMPPLPGNDAFWKSLRNDRLG